MVNKNIKFGIRVPQTVNEALRLDENNGNCLRIDVIAKDTNAVMIEFKLLNGGEKPPPNYQEIIYHIIFDIKMEYSRRKTRCVVGGHATVASPTLAYASVVLQDIFRIALTLAALNDLEFKTYDIQNVYFTAPCLEKIWITVG